MVEVAHDDSESLVFLAKNMIDRDLDIVELDEGCRSGGGVACLLHVRESFETCLGKENKSIP